MRSAEMRSANAECKMRNAELWLLIFTPLVKERENGVDTSSSRRYEYGAGSVFSVRDQAARRQQRGNATYVRPFYTIIWR